MTTPNQCPQCGTTLPADAPEQLCPACLMSGAIPSDSEVTMKVTGANALAKGTALPSMFPFDFGGYRVLSLLGRGGMGAVYEAEQRETGRRVALKVLGHDLDSEDMRKRFLREGRLAAAVTHPNSIYIFGTEEIEGSPVIVMEIAGGGTLKDELKQRGPLPVKDAVDAMLQIIAGLEAAHAGGVLHRDVKPANCFLAPDGTAKVGDFGLSVSTLARQDTQLTASGMMLGTPSFAPPEQLRGDDLDVRADIYSVGATLYTLLTGRAPFEGTNAVQVVAAVLDKAPAPVTALRQDVPTALAQVITRCMAKRRELRFADYAALREALLPFSSAVPEPAPPGLRFAAGLLDDFIASLPEIILGTVFVIDYSATFLSERTAAHLLQWLGIWSAYIAYFVIAEGVWGAGIGKALCGLRVVGPNGGTPGVGRALVRTLVYDVVAMSVWLPLVVTSAKQYATITDNGETLVQWWFGVMVASFFALFVTMRRSNGFAAVQDLVSGTRVVRHAKANVRPRLKISEVKQSVPADGERIGPYVVIQPLDDGLLLAHDPALRRDVWIQRGTNCVGEARRDIARPGRLRWLGGTAEWNAFEAPGGQALSAFEKQSQPWAAVRCWLADIAAEFVAAEKDGTLPVNPGIAQVWITREGRAVLLDDKERDLPSPVAPCLAAQSLLDAISKHALDPKTVPLHARDVLQKIASAAFDRMSFIAGNLQSLLSKPATISNRRRAVSLCIVPAAVALSVALIGWEQLSSNAEADAFWKKRHPDQPPLSAVLRLRDVSDALRNSLFAWKPDLRVHRATTVHIAQHYGHELAGSLAKSPQEDPDTPLDTDQRAEIAGIIIQGAAPDYPESFKATLTPEMRNALTPPPTSQEIASSDEIIKQALPAFLTEESTRYRICGINALRNTCIVIAIVQFLTLLIFGTTLGQRVFGFAVLNKKGEVAGRLRMLSRWFIAWILFILVDARIEIHEFFHQTWGTADIMKCSAFGILWVLAVIAAIMQPQQGMHDDQAKTWLVPR